MFELKKTVTTLAINPLNSPFTFFILYKLIAHPLLGWLLFGCLSIHFVNKFVSNLSKIRVAKEVLLLYAVPFYAFCCLVIVGETSVAIIFLKSVPIMILGLEILRKQSATQILISLFFVLLIELTYKSGWVDLISGGLRKGGASLVSGGLTEIHSSAVFLILLLIFIFKNTSIKISTVFIILLTRSRAAIIIVAYYLISTSNYKSRIIYFTFFILGLVIFFEEIMIFTRFSEVLNATVSESQVLQRKLDQVSNVSKLTLGNAILINPFLHDVSVEYYHILWNVLQLPLNYFATLGVLGLFFLISLMGKTKWYKNWIYLSLANLSGVGLWQYFDGTLGPVVYFDGYIFLSLLIIKGMGHDKKSN